MIGSCASGVSPWTTTTVAYLDQFIQNAPGKFATPAAETAAWYRDLLEQQGAATEIVASLAE
jgi:hypothetical protein